MKGDVWTPQELQRLMDMRDGPGHRKITWGNIGRELDNRGEDACRMAYKREKDRIKAGEPTDTAAPTKPRKQHIWTAEDESILADVCRNFKKEDHVHSMTWANVAEIVGGGHSARACSIRWERNLTQAHIPNRYIFGSGRKGILWTPAECELVVLQFQIYGNQYIKYEIPGRTNCTIRAKVQSLILDGTITPAMIAADMAKGRKYTTTKCTYNKRHKPSSL